MAASDLVEHEIPLIRLRAHLQPARGRDPSPALPKQAHVGQPAQAAEAAASPEKATPGHPREQ